MAATLREVLLVLCLALAAAVGALATRAEESTAAAAAVPNRLKDRNRSMAPPLIENRRRYPVEQAA